MAEEGLIIKIIADAKEFVSGADKAVKDAKGKFKGLGDEISKELKRVETVGTKAFNGITGAIGGMATAATAAIGGLVKGSTDAFAEYQQLEGGINKLFGDGSNKLKGYAAEAYRTAGMSANEYMQNVTGFSAALINSLGGDTVKAADVADMAMRDIADNANTYGKYSAQELAGVYQALAKGTYTTLDNLNLGFGGSKEGMEALIRKAEELDDSFKVVHKTGKSGNDEITFGFNDMVQAIHIVQENMKIAGTTQNEAATTISGSLGMVKASWQDVLVSISGGGKDLDKSISQLIESVGHYAHNLMPVVEKALNGIGDMVVKIAPIIAEKLPEVTANILPKMLNAISTLAKGAGEAIIKTIPAIIDTIMQVIPQFLSVGIEIVNSILKGIVNNIFGIQSAAESLVTQFMDGIRSIMPRLLTIARVMISTILKGFIEYKTLIFEIGIQLITTLVQGIADEAPTLAPQVVDAVMHIFDVLIENLPTLIDSLVTIITELTNAIMAKLPDLLGKVGQVVYDLCNKLLDHLPELLQDAVKIVAAVLALVAEILLAALISIGQHLVDWWNNSIKPWFDKIGDNIKNFFSTLGKAFEFWWNSTIRPWFEKIKTDVKTKVEEIKTSISEKVGNIKSTVTEKVNAIKTTISEKVTDIKTKVTETIGNLKTSISEKVSAIKTAVTDKIAEIKSNVSSKVEEIFDKVVNTIGELPSRMLSIGQNIVEGIWDGISGAKDWISQKISGFVDGLVGGVKGLLGINSPSKVFAKIGEYMTEGLVVGMEGETTDLKNTAEKQIAQLKSMYSGINLAPQINAGKLNALRMAQTMHTVTNENGNVFNFYQTFEGAGADAGEAMFRQFQRRVRYSGGVL